MKDFNGKDININDIGVCIYKRKIRKCIVISITEKMVKIGFKDNLIDKDAFIFPEKLVITHKADNRPFAAKLEEKVRDMVQREIKTRHPHGYIYI